MKTFILIAAAATVSLTTAFAAAQADDGVGLSADQVTPKMATLSDQIHAKQAETRQAVTALVREARVRSMHPAVLMAQAPAATKLAPIVHRIQVKQAQNRQAIVALVEQSRARAIHPVALAQQNPAYGTVQLATRPVGAPADAND